ncbi:nuclear transport factor 2 family protein [Rhizobium calliandrae]|nr:MULTISPECIES: nuclear transport factor 2 family protein [Rhizobium]MDL2406920.1 nuclear transport factor 2 family protein [Rhizobium calliandrae]
MISTTKNTLEVVDAYYQAGVEKRLTDFGSYLHDDFVTTAPNYLPWGGVHHGGAFFREQVLPNLPDVLDFGRFSYDVFFANGENAIALVNFGLTGRDEMIKISEHWTVRDGKAINIWVAYFEPQALLDSLKIPHGLTRAAA